MRKFRGYVSIGLVGCKRAFEFEVEDDSDQDMIEEIAYDTAREYMDYYFEEVA